MSTPAVQLVHRTFPTPDTSRVREEPSDPLRSAFHLDRDRILESKAFRRLGAKTQVFIAPEGDHYRTRMTHTLSVAAVSRTIARNLGLDEYLTEAIALGHDLGHAPFGHTGERALDAVLRERFGMRFRHNEQSLRIVECVEGDGAGLNLTTAVRDGIVHHTGDAEPRTAEGQVVRIADRFAYVNHDIDDAIRAGILRESDLPQPIVRLLGETAEARIDCLIADLIRHTRETGTVGQGDTVGSAFLELRGFMFDEVYGGAISGEDRARVEEFVPRLVNRYMDDPTLVPGLQPPAVDAEPPEWVPPVVDFIAGMTDRYCLRLMRELFLPREWRLTQ